MRELYVYWKAPRARAGVVHGELHAALAELMRRHPGLQARLLRRADEGGDTVTWMETYAAAGGVSSALQAQIEAALAPVLAQLGAGPRHTEVFEPAA
jgi:hypothetical protein